MTTDPACLAVRPVAICTLASHQLRQSLSAVPKLQGCIVAGLTTENIGIEQLVQFCVTTPALRAIVICGDDPQQAIGYLPGQTLLALKANGLDAQGRIIGAPGKRPFIQNLTPEAIAHFRTHVELIDAIGQTDVEGLTYQALAWLGQDLPPAPAFVGDVERPVPNIVAQALAPMQCDPAGYLVIHADLAAKTITVEHFENGGVRTCRITGDSAGSVLQALLAQSIITRHDHIAYLGRELYRAQQALAQGSYYIQDDIAPQYSLHQSCDAPDEHPALADEALGEQSANPCTPSGQTANPTPVALCC
jgi:tetrahydromethanopterin S-methyltransferase subunit A